jgi:hypothetical protein
LRFHLRVLSIPLAILLAAGCSADRKEQPSEESADAAAPATATLSGSETGTPFDTARLTSIAYAAEESAVCAPSELRADHRRSDNRLSFEYSPGKRVLHGHWYCAPDLDVTIDDADAGGLANAIARLRIVDFPRTAAPEDCTSEEMIGTPSRWTAVYDATERVTVLQQGPLPCKDSQSVVGDDDLYEIAWGILER